MESKNVAVIVVVIIIALGVAWWLYPALNEEVPVPDILNGNSMNTLKLTSLAFKEGEFIPSKYTCDEINISPPLQISGVPDGTKSLVLIMDDPDVPKQLRPDGVFDHWALYNIPPTATFFDEGKFEGTSGLNGRNEAKYTGPCPPGEYQPTTHRYFFKLYATDLPTLNFIKAPTKKDLEGAIDGHVLETATLTGLYDRTKTVREND